MKHHFKRLAALISLSLTHDASSAAVSKEIDVDLLPNDPIKLSDLNISVSQVLAGHRSHSSHQSHRSSSSGGSYRAPSSGGSYRAPTKKTPSRSNTIPSLQEKKGSSTADPLGQKPRPLSSYPSSKPKKMLPTDKQALKNIIMRVQLTLQFEGYYDGGIDGVMGPKTRSAIKQYKKDKGITSKGYLDAETLNALGIKGF